MKNRYTLRLAKAANGHTPKMKKAAASPQSRNICIHGQRTTIRFRPEMWDALKEIVILENCSVHDLCSAVSDLKAPEDSFTSELRVFIMEYYRSASLVNNQVAWVNNQISDNQSSPYPAARRSAAGSHAPTN